MIESDKPEFSYEFLRASTKPVHLLIEASAGTGKTYTLERIIIHYLIHSRFNLEEILLVTFTNKATRELRFRIRAIIQEMLADPLRAAEILQEIGLEQARNWEEHLSRQLRNFAAAPIFTIHGFSQLVLKTYPVESDALLNIRLDNSYYTELLRDYLRNTLLEGRLPTDYGTLISGDDLTFCLDQAMALPGCDHAENLIRQMLTLKNDGLLDPSRYFGHIAGSPSLSEAWNIVYRNHKKALWQLLSNPISATETVETIELQQELFIQFPSMPINTPDELAEFCQKVIGLNVMRFLLAGLVDYRDKQSRYFGIMNHDDQIAKLDQASREGGLLLPRLQDQYKLILIDEFQDTNRIQWDIFRRIAGSTSHLITVGDPKQAIYGFIGADLNTYLAARQDLAQSCKLSRNFRSTPSLVQACNGLFHNIFNTAKEPSFALRLHHESIEPGLQSIKERRLIGPDSQSLPVLNGIFISDEDWKKPEQRDLALSEGIISAIQYLVGQASIEEATGMSTPVRYQDICILTQNNRQGQEIMKKLTKSGIPARLSGQSKLFESTEAKELQILLDAIAEPTRASAVRRLLLTRFFGIGADELRSWQKGDHLGDYLELCARWHDDYPRKGLEGIFAELEGALRVRLLNGEVAAATRSLTNFRHLADLFHAHQRGSHIPTARIGIVFRELCANAKAEEDDNFRLDSDMDMVCIMTMHSSKGLEFPIVFLDGGFMEIAINGATAKRGGQQLKSLLPTLDCQISDEHWQRTIDPWNSPEGQKAHFRQEWEAWIRLFYVAATRARSALFLPAWHPQTQQSEKASFLQFMYEQNLILPASLHPWHPQPASSSRYQANPAMQTTLSLQNQLPSNIPQRWRSVLIPQTERQSSFTSLSHHGGSHTAIVDQLFAVATEATQDLSIDMQVPVPEPGGTQYGIIFHAAMELMDFEAYHQSGQAGRDQILSRLFSEKLDKLARGMRFGQGFPSFNSIKEYLRQQLHLVMETELAGPENTSRPIHALDGLHARREATFHARVPESAIVGAPERFDLNQRPMDPGFLTGSVDFLVPVDGKWCIIDWKTNRAGSGSVSELEQVMHDNEYYLQGLIYQSAVHQWLCTHRGVSWDPKTTDNARTAQQLFETEMGPAWYVFTRYGKAINAQVSWNELLDFQQKAVLYARPL